MSKVLELDADSLQKGWGGSDQYWFSLSDYVIRDSAFFSTMDKPDHISQTAYLVSLGYIPYFVVNNEEVIRAFVDSLPVSKLKETLVAIPADNYVESFWKYFNVYPALSDGWNDFEEKYLLSKAIKWCEQNNINYVIK